MREAATRAVVCLPGCHGPAYFLAVYRIIAAFAGTGSEINDFIAFGFHIGLDVVLHLHCCVPGYILKESPRGRFRLPGGFFHFHNSVRCMCRPARLSLCRRRCRCRCRCRRWQCRSLPSPRPHGGSQGRGGGQNQLNLRQIRFFSQTALLYRNYF